MLLPGDRSLSFLLGVCVSLLRSIYFLDFDSGKQLVMAVQRSGLNILNTFVLAVLAIYVFAVVTFLVFTSEPHTPHAHGHTHSLADSRSREPGQGPKPRYVPPPRPSR
jgi:hypothetical protein